MEIVRRLLWAALLLAVAACGQTQQSVGGQGSGDMKPGACEAVRTTAGTTRQPADIILVVDNSSGMTEAISAVQSNINNNFAAVLARSNLDYRVILISLEGTAAVNDDICISKPLSGSDCNPPPPNPVNGPRFFHYSTLINRNNSFEQVLLTYNQADPSGQAPGGWSQWLRIGAQRSFLFISLDNATLSASQFDAELLALLPARFGTAAQRGYVAHSIVGLNPNTVPTAPWLPSDPEQFGICSGNGGAVSAGLNYQDLSILTGGLRFPICENTSFDAVFQRIAAGVLAYSPVSCSFPVPAAPAGQEIDLTTVQVDYQPGSGAAAQTFTQVPSAAQCTPGTFYLSGGTVDLCPDTCKAVQSDGGASLEVQFNCLVQLM